MSELRNSLGVKPAILKKKKHSELASKLSAKPTSESKEENETEQSKENTSRLALRERWTRHIRTLDVIIESDKANEDLRSRLKDIRETAKKFRTSLVDNKPPEDLDLSWVNRVIKYGVETALARAFIDILSDMPEITSQPTLS